MNVICVISDNSFFSLGFKSLQSPGDTVLVLTPLKAIENNKLLKGVDFFYVFITNRQAHLQLCKQLRQVSGAIVFFIDFDLSETTVHSCFFPSRSSLQTFKQITHTRRKGMQRSFNAPSGRNMQRIGHAASGLADYLACVSEKAQSAKSMHNYKRVLLRGLGINTVSIHNLFMSEYIAAGIQVASKRISS